ncbi:MAG: hypothetical protein KatS3mg077_0825 [Candidatus Binatia bacterium]|nr:MAG: hypothetical protein KatS3mg077_0825 [Candidatus Binatia bacterium]
MAAGVLVALAFSFGCHRGEEPLPPLPQRLISISDKFFDVAALDADTAIVVGYGGKILRTSDGGFTWTLIPSGTQEALYRVRFVGADRGWICGQDGVILHTEDGGLSWSRQNSGTNAYLFSIYFVDPQFGWAVGDKSLAVHTRDGGHTWTLHKITSAVREELSADEALAEQDPILYDVYFRDREHGWVSGEFGRLFQTTDGGHTWIARERSLLGEEIVDPLSIPTFFGVHFNAQEGIAVGLEGKVARSLDGGVTWKLDTVESPVPLTDPLFAPFLFPGGRGWIVGASGQVLVRPNTGEPWRPASLGMEIATWLRSVTWWNDQIGWVVGGYGLILTTRDGGRTWLPAFG